MAIVNLGQQDLEIGNDWHQFTSAVVAPGDLVPLRLLMISPSPDDLISRAIVRYSVEAPFPGGTIYQVNGGFDVHYSGSQQLFTIELPPFPDDIGRLHIEAKRFYRFRSYNPGSPMELSIEYESDHVRNMNTPEDKFRLFTHGAITGGTVGTLDFSGVTVLWRIYAVWLDMTGVGVDDSMEITINNGGNVTAYWDLPLEQVPWQPPPNIVGAANTIFIRPTADVANVVLYAKPAELDGVVAV